MSTTFPRIRFRWVNAGICHHHPSGLSSSKIYFIHQQSRIIFILLIPSGNILSVWIFNKKDVELKPSFANLLKCLSVFDTIFLVRGLYDQCANRERLTSWNSLRTDELVSTNYNFDYIPFDSSLNHGLPPNLHQSQEIWQRLLMTEFNFEIF